MYKPEGISLVICKFAKSNKEISYDNLKKEFSQFSGVDIEYIPEYAIYEIVSRTLGDAMERGLIKSYQMYDFASHLYPHPVLAKLYNDDTSFELKILQGMLNMLRFTQVKNNEQILVDLT